MFNVVNAIYLYLLWLPTNAVKCAFHMCLSIVVSCLNPNVVIAPGRMCSGSLHLSANGCKTKMVPEMVWRRDIN